MTTLEAFHVHSMRQNYLRFFVDIHVLYDKYGRIFAVKFYGKNSVMRRFGGYLSRGAHFIPVWEWFSNGHGRE
jgi:hypothetical protein